MDLKRGKVIVMSDGNTYAVRQAKTIENKTAVLLVNVLTQMHAFAIENGGELYFMDSIQCNKFAPIFDEAKQK